MMRRELGQPSCSAPSCNSSPAPTAEGDLNVKLDCYPELKRRADEYFPPRFLCPIQRPKCRKEEKERKNEKEKEKGKEKENFRSILQCTDLVLWLSYPSRHWLSAPGITND